MKFHRTPDERFEDLADYPFRPNYADVSDFEGGTLQMHYVDEGPRDGPVAVLIHGNPTWSYMWRKLIPVLANAGYRTIAIDLIGMGRSDKPSRMKDYSIARHQAWVEEALFENLGLTDANMILHDWGGVIGLRAIANHQSRVASVVLSNTGLPFRDPSEAEMATPIANQKMLRRFQLYVRFNPWWKHWNMLRQIVRTEMTDEEVAGFAAPYPSAKFTIGNRAFTQMLPTKHDNPMLVDNWHALEKLKDFEKPFLTLYSDKDVVAPTGYRSVRPAIPGTRDFETIILPGGSHFLLEDIPEDFAREVFAFLTAIGGRDA